MTTNMIKILNPYISNVQIYVLVWVARSQTSQGELPLQAGVLTCTTNLVVHMRDVYTYNPS